MSGGCAIYTFSGDNLVLKNCRITGGVLLTGANAKVERCEIIGGLSLSGTRTAYLDRNNIHETTDDLLHITSDRGRVSNVILTNNFLHGVRPVCKAHSDGIQVRGIDGLTLTNNVIDMGVWRQACGEDALNAAVFLEQANGGNQNVTLRGNYLNGGGYTLRINATANVEVRDNRFGSDEKYGLILISAPNGVVKGGNNVRDADGAPVALP